MLRIPLDHTLAMAALALSGTARAAPSPLRVRPWTYDPDGAGTIDARWVAEAGVGGQGLLLKKGGPTTANAAAGAAIDGASGTLSELGFDYRNDGHQGGGAPRFNVTTSAGTYFFACSQGVHTSVPRTTNWTRVRFGNADASPADGAPPWPGFGTAVVSGIDLVFDEGADVGVGFAWLDNIDVNGTLLRWQGNVT